MIAVVAMSTRFVFSAIVDGDYPRLKFFVSLVCLLIILYCMLYYMITIWQLENTIISLTQCVG